MWTPTTREQYTRTAARYETDLRWRDPIEIPLAVAIAEEAALKIKKGAEMPPMPGSFGAEFETARSAASQGAAQQPNLIQCLSMELRSHLCPQGAA